MMSLCIVFLIVFDSFLLTTQITGYAAAHSLKASLLSARLCLKAQDYLSISKPPRKWINHGFIMMSALGWLRRKVNGATLCSAITFHNGKAAARGEQHNEMFT